MPEDPVTPRERFPHPISQLALDLSSEAVRLLARAGKQDRTVGWVELGHVPLAGAGFRAGIEALCREAEARGDVPLTLLLPPEQILVRRYVLGRASRDRDEALRRIAEDTGRPAGELTVALSPPSEGEVVTVLAVPRRTVQEALDYARRWGFRPSAVSTRAGAERFGAGVPVFAPPEPAPRRFVPMRAAAAAAGLLVLGLGAWGAQGLMPDDGPAADRQGGQVGTLAAVAPGDTPRPVADEPASPRRSPGTVDLPRPSASTGKAAEPPTRIASTASADAGTMPRPIAHVAADVSARPSPGWDKLERGGAGKPQKQAARQAGADAAPLMTGTDGHPDRAAAEPDAEIVLAASTMAPVRVPGRPVPRPSLTDVAAAEEDPVETEGSDTPSDIESDSRLAVSSAPRPAARPERSRGLELAAVTGVAPPRIGNSLAQAGLTLDATSLIGVIDTRTGREALLRMSSGDFLKVTRGDTVAGWRVSAIGQDTMRLTRGGETRTLLLVTR